MRAPCRLVSTAQAARLRRGRGHPARGPRVAPRERGGRRDLPWHMVQHLLLLAVAAPLLAVGEPVTVMTQALPDRMRRKVRPVVRRMQPLADVDPGLARLDGGRASSSAPPTLALWHVPALYDAAVAQHGVHVLEHVTFVATADAVLVDGAGGEPAVPTRPRGPGGVRRDPAGHRARDPPDPRPRRPGTRRTGTVPPRCATSRSRARSCGASAALALVVGAAALFASWLANMDRVEDARGVRSRRSSRGDPAPRPVVRRPARCVAASRARRSTRCSRTTGRSCWARSRCTASSSSS